MDRARLGDSGVSGASLADGTFSFRTLVSAVSLVAALNGSRPLGPDEACFEPLVFGEISIKSTSPMASVKTIMSGSSAGDEKIPKGSSAATSSVAPILGFSNCKGGHIFLNSSKSAASLGESKYVMLSSAENRLAGGVEALSRMSGFFFSPIFL